MRLDFHPATVNPYHPSLMDVAAPFRQVSIGGIGAMADFPYYIPGGENDGNAHAGQITFDKITGGSFAGAAA